MPAACDPSLHTESAGATGYFHIFRLLTMAVRHDDVPSRDHGAARGTTLCDTAFR